MVTVMTVAPEGTAEEHVSVDIELDLGDDDTKGGETEADYVMECRICLEAEGTEEKLCSPCDCQGSVCSPSQRMRSQHSDN